MFVGGRHWKVLVLLMIQTGMIGMVVLGGDREGREVHCLCFE